VVTSIISQVKLSLAISELSPGIIVIFKTDPLINEYSSSSLLPFSYTILTIFFENLIVKRPVNPIEVIFAVSESLVNI
jgi:hypothetical protein